MISNLNVALNKTNQDSIKLPKRKKLGLLTSDGWGGSLLAASATLLLGRFAGNLAAFLCSALLGALAGSLAAFAGGAACDTTFGGHD